MLNKSWLLLTPLMCLADVKLNYNDVVKRAVEYGVRAKILNQQNKTAFYSLEAARKSQQPIYSLTGGIQSTQESTGSMKASQSFGAGTTASIAWDFAHNAGKFDLVQPILRGFGQNSLNLENAENAYVQANIALVNSLNSIIQDVLNAYWSVISAEKNVEVQKLARKSAMQLLEQYKIKVKMGALPRYNLVEQQAQLDRFKLQELQQNTARVQAQQLLKVLINLPQTTNINLTGKLDLDVFGKMPSLESVLVRVKENNLSIISAKMAVAAAKNNLKIATNAAQPELNVTASMQKDTGASIGLSLNVPLNDPALKQQLLNANNNLEQANTNLIQVVQDNVQNANNLWQSINSKFKENKILESNLATSKRLYELSIDQYKYGKASSLDVVIRQKTLVSDQQALISNIISFLQSYVQLKALQGDLLGLFGMNIGHNYEL